MKPKSEFEKTPGMAAPPAAATLSLFCFAAPCNQLGVSLNQLSVGVLQLLACVAKSVVSNLKTEACRGRSSKVFNCIDFVFE